MPVRPTHDQVLSLAPDRAAATAALPLAVPTAWSAAGHDDEAVWGQYVATAAEPYDVAVDLSDHDGPAYRCNCPSRKVPCKHALALLLLHADGGVGPARRLPFAADWLQRRRRRAAEDAAPTDEQGGLQHDDAATSLDASADGDHSAGAGRGLGGGSSADRTGPGNDPTRDKRRLERTERMMAGLRELDRWLADRMRVGLTAAELAQRDTWERVAARLVDAQCGALANRVKRVATLVGQHPRWHEDVLEELAVLHLLAVGAQRTGSLPPTLADGVHVATGLTAAKADVAAGVPTTATWLVAGESRTREDRITVQRTWLLADSGPPLTWAMLLDFGAFGRELVSEHRVGSALSADIHWYPGGIALRALVGRQHADPRAGTTPPTQPVAAAVAAAGWAVAAEPWLERFPVSVRATPAPLGGGRWVLADDTGAVPIAPGFSRVAELVAVSGGEPVVIVGEWSREGCLPLTLFDGGVAVAL